MSRGSRKGYNVEMQIGVLHHECQNMELGLYLECCREPSLVVIGWAVNAFIHSPGTLSTYYLKRIVLDSWISRFSCSTSKDTRRSWNDFERFFLRYAISQDLRLVLIRAEVLLTE